MRSSYGRITGQLDPYVDPYCSCRLRTMFIGKLERNVITGIFMTRHLDSDELTGGEWRVTRKPRRIATR